MIDNIDIILSAFIDLIKNNELNKAKDQLDAALHRMLDEDFKCRQKRVSEIVKCIERLKRVKHSLETTVYDLPENLQFHAREGMRDIVEVIKCQIATLMKQKSDYSKP